MGTKGPGPKDPKDPKKPPTPADRQRAGASMHPVVPKAAPVMPKAPAVPKAPPGAQKKWGQKKSPPPPPSVIPKGPTPEELKMATQKEKVLGELYSTESSYQNSLNLFMQKTMGYENDPLISKQRKEIDTIQAMSAPLLKEQSVSNLIALLNFIQADGFKVYENYLSSYESYANQMGKIQKEGKMDPETAREIAQIPIMPVQRIPRYILLLKEVVKNTPKDAPDYVLWSEQLARMEKRATMMNEAMGFRNDMHKFLKENPKMDSEVRNKVRTALYTEDPGYIGTTYQYAKHFKQLQDDKPSIFNIFRQERGAVYSTLIKQVKELLLTNTYSKETDKINSQILAILDGLPKPNPTNEQLSQASTEIDRICGKNLIVAEAEKPTIPDVAPRKGVAPPAKGLTPTGGIALLGLTNQKQQKADHKPILTEYAVETAASKAAQKVEPKKVEAEKAEPGKKPKWPPPRNPFTPRGGA